MIRSAIIIWICFFAQTATGKITPPGWQWATAGENTSESHGLSISTDKDGNIYVAGYFKGSLKIGNSQLQSIGNRDVFIAKYDANSNAVWAKRAGGIANDECSGISVDETGVYVTGYFTDSANFEGNKLTAVAGKDVFVAKYDHNGSLIWIKSAGSEYDDGGMDISVHSNGLVYVGGYFSSTMGNSPGTIHFDTIPLVSMGVTEAFFVTYNLNGAINWAVSAGNVTHDNCWAITTDKTGNLFTTGDYPNPSITKYDASGHLVLSVSPVYDDIVDPKSVAVDDNGNFYGLGNYWGKVTFGNIQLPQQDQPEIYFVKYDASGTAKWAKHIGWLSFDSGNDVSVDGNGYIYITGTCNQFGIFDNDTFDAQQEGNVFVAKYTPDGNLVWVRGAFASNPLSINVNAKGETAITGYFKGPQATFGDHTLSNGVPGTDNMFAAKLPTFATDINDIPSLLNTRIYPNPVNNKLYIDNANNTAYHVYDINGRLLTSGNVEGNTIDVHSLPAGTYLLQLVTDNKRQALQFIKE